MDPISHPDLWLCPLFLLPTQSPAFCPPPPPSSSRSWSTSHLFPPPRFSSDLVSHYLSEIKTTVPRIPRNLRSLRRGVRQTVVPVVCSSEAGWCVFLVFQFFYRLSAGPLWTITILISTHTNEHKKHTFSFHLDRLTTCPWLMNTSSPYIVIWLEKLADTLKYDFFLSFLCFFLFSLPPISSTFYFSFYRCVSFFSWCDYFASSMYKTEFCSNPKTEDPWWLTVCRCARDSEGIFGIVAALLCLWEAYKIKTEMPTSDVLCRCWSEAVDVVCACVALLMASLSCQTELFTFSQF